MRLKSRVDKNQQEVARALRRVGASVQFTHTVGGGCPDLMVGFRGQTYLLEVKDGDKPKWARVLTEDQKRWHQKWRGHAAVVENVEEALKAIGAL